MPRDTKKDKASITTSVVEKSTVAKKTNEKSILKKNNTDSNKTKKASKNSTASKTSNKKTSNKKVANKKTSVSKSTTKKNTPKNTTKTNAPKQSATISFKSILSRRPKKVKITSDENLDIDVNESTVEKSAVLEYYDLPYRYNQTIVKILAQTPSILFVYWDISDEDRSRLVNKYGYNFFDVTRPVLIIHNKTKNYSFEIEINDFANSWYLRMQEPDCEYIIELGRRNRFNPSEYIYITSSNDLISPNDHVLFDRTDFTNIKFKNVKNGHITTKDFGSLRLLTNIGNIYNKDHKVFSFYNKFYKDEVLDNKTMFSNPSSGNPTSGNF